MTKTRFTGILQTVVLIVALLFTGLQLWAQDNDFPEKPNPPRLVNDLAGMMSAEQSAHLEEKLSRFEQATSNQVTIVTVQSIGSYDEADYAIKLGKKWGVGRDGRDNGVLILAAAAEHKLFIATGKGLEGALTDYTCGKIRDNMKPYFRQKDFYGGFEKATDDIIAATKGEFKGEGKPAAKKGFPFAAIVIIIVILIFISKMGGRNRGGGGNYISGGGVGDFAAGWFLSELMRGGRSGGGGSWGGGDSSGGFGGFGGGDFGGGGAGGSWD